MVRTAYFLLGFLLATTVAVNYYERYANFLQQTEAEYTFALMVKAYQEGWTRANYHKDGEMFNRLYPCIELLDQESTINQDLRHENESLRLLHSR